MISSSKIVAVTISRFKNVEWFLPEIPNWFLFTENEDLPMLDQGGMSGLIGGMAYQKDWKSGNPGPRKYITYLAAKRNMAVKLALEKYPESDHVLMCDTYYVPQILQLRRLISDYMKVQKIEEASLGGAAWGIVRTELGHYLSHRKKDWYDKWGVPDLMFTPYGWKPESNKMMNNLWNPPLPGLFHTSSLIGVHIFPRIVWDRGTRYGVYDDLHGCEHNYFFEHSGIPRYTDLNTDFIRKNVYPFMKCLRIKLHLGRFVKRS